MRENNRKPQQKTDYTSGDNAHRYSLLLIGMACNFCSDTPVFHLRRPDHGPYRVQLYTEYGGVTGLSGNYSMAIYGILKTGIDEYL